MKKLIALAASAAMTAALINCMPAASAGTGLGDANADGKVNALDASEILCYYAEMSVSSAEDSAPEAPPNSDMNKDGVINAADASYVLSYYSYTATGGTVTPENYVKISSTTKDITLSADCSAKMKADNYVNVSWRSYENNESVLKKIGDKCSIAGYRIKMYSQSYDSGSDKTVRKDLASYEVRSAKDVEQKNLYGEGTTVYKQAKVKIPEDISFDPQLDYGFEVSAIADINGIEVNVVTHQTVLINKTELIVNTAKLTPHDNYPLYNIKGSTPKQTATYIVTAEDKKILDKFAEENFTPDISNYDKIECLWRWVNKNITYASGDLYKEIASDSWVSACLVKKKGQCLQYNGAVAELLAYMGYDVYMLEMWLGANNTNQHFRTEVNIDGNAYSIEVGNDGAYSGWMWLFEPIESSIKGAQ